MTATFQGFRSLIDHGPDAVSLIDSQGEILYGSASTTKMFGYQPEELLGRNCLELIHPEDRVHSRRALRDVLAPVAGPCQWNARVRCKDGNYSWVESTASNLLSDQEVQAIVMHQRKINARKGVEAEGQQHAEPLTGSTLRLEEFSYTVAHDLREPLRAISVYAGMLGQKTQMDGIAAQLTTRIVDGVARMSALIDDLLSFANNGLEKRLRPIDLRHAVEQASLNLAPAIEECGAVVTVGGLPMVQGSELHLVRLFQNLISNAVKYRRTDPVQIHVTAEQDGDVWIVRVEDNGIGVAPEHHTRIFEPFIRLDHRDIPGTGLGLAVCKSIVERLGGRMWIESELGAGSTFCFTICLADNSFR